MASNGTLVFYASSSDHAVHALDMTSGETRWRFFTEGPVRLAPTVHGDRLFPNAIRTNLQDRIAGPRADWVRQIEDDHDLIIRHGDTPSARPAGGG